MGKLVQTKAELLRAELVDLIVYDKRFNGDQDSHGRVDEAGALHAAINWVFKEQSEELRAEIFTRIQDGPWTVERFVELLTGAVH